MWREDEEVWEGEVYMWVGGDNVAGKKEVMAER